MFTGIIAGVGEVTALARRGAGVALTVRTRLRGLRNGESIAVSGACMTVVGARGGTFTVDVSAESLRRTTLGTLRVGSRVNLERSLRLGDRLGGHFVFGHVDGIGVLRAIEPEGESALYRFALPGALAALLAEKGSIAIDGISLTVFSCTARSFSVAVVPYTAKVTTLGTRRPGDRVNLESDMLARYVAGAVARHLRHRRGRDPRK